MIKSLKSLGHDLSKPEKQLKCLQLADFKSFQDSLKENSLFPLKPSHLEIFQMNLGKMCNQVCKHCHVDAGPDRKEIMTKETMELCLNAIKKSNCHTVDLTGGAPEMNPNFEWLVKELHALGKKIMVRCNLTIILANKKYQHLPSFFKEHQVEVISSLPYYSANKTNQQRGEGVFEKSILALKMLNEVGYGKTNSGLVLNLVYNPAGAFLPGSQAGLEAEFKLKLKKQFDIEFNALFAITNLPISRFLDYLCRSENLESYMDKLIQAFNPMAAANVMCRNTISVSWDGFLFDCDFNQMLALKLDSTNQHIENFDECLLLDRNIVLNQHCYGCTAGAGSSCGGSVA